MKKVINRYVIPPVAYILITVVSLTLRAEVINAEIEERAKGEKGPIILAFWHNRLFFLTWRYLKTRKEWKVLVSPSVDGDIIAHMLSLFGFGLTRGSSFKNSRSALRSMMRSVTDGFSVALIADGSRGPR